MDTLKPPVGDDTFRYYAVFFRIALEQFTIPYDANTIGQRAALQDPMYMLRQRRKAAGMFAIPILLPRVVMVPADGSYPSSSIGSDAMLDTMEYNGEVVSFKPGEDPWRPDVFDADASNTYMLARTYEDYLRGRRFHV